MPGEPQGLAGGGTGLSWLLSGIWPGTWPRAAVPFVPVGQLNSPLFEARAHLPVLLGPAREAGHPVVGGRDPRPCLTPRTQAPRRLFPPVPPADLCLPLAAEAWGALRGRGNWAFPKTGQPAHMLPVPVQRRSGGHQEEEVGHRGCWAVWPCHGGLEGRGGSGLTLLCPQNWGAWPGMSTAAACVPRRVMGAGRVPLTACRPGSARPGHKGENAHGLCFLGGQFLGTSFWLSAPQLGKGPRLPTDPLSNLAAHLSPCSEDSFMVQDYAQVDYIRVQKMEPSDPSLLGAGGGSRSSSVPHPFQVTLLHNSEGRQEKILLSSDSA